MIYVDEKGGKYGVLSLSEGLDGHPIYATCYRKPGLALWRYMKRQKWYEDRELAEKDLKIYAEKHNLKEVKV